MNSFRPETTRQLLWRRLLVFLPAMFILAVAECSFFAQLYFLPATPDLMLGFVVAVAMLDSQHSAAICGIGAGFIIDAVGATGISFSPLFYMLCGAFCAVLAKKMLPSFLSWLVELAIFSVVKGLYTLAGLYYSWSGAPIGTVLLRTVLPEIICTFVICLPIFFIVKLCMIPIDSKRRLRL
ncbi:MAG: hypothetical protein IKB02_03245 [Clostridia bacterium]|nr:hypothetical protein [Clostridia bacterium]